MSVLLWSDDDGGVRTAILNRPDRRNALSGELLDAIARLVDDVAADPTVRVLVVTGTGGRAFCAGADIAELDQLDEATAYERMRCGQSIFDKLAALPQPVVAAINGHALGGGLELAMACDIRFASDTATLGQPEIDLANIPGWGGTQRLPRLVGPATAKRLILAGERISAHEGLRIGLVERVVPAADLPTVVADFARVLAAKSPTALTLAKRAIDTGLDEGFDAGLEFEARAVAACCATEEQRRAVTHFLGRRSSAQQEKGPRG
jgi:enoyl-CoA hydratase